MDRLRLEEIEKVYDGFRLGPLSFPIKAGYITGLIGPNGSGKTTTIRAILDLIHLSGGRILYDGKEVQDNRHLKDMGTVLDASYFAKDWTARDVERVLSLGYANWDGDQFFRRVKADGLNLHTKIKDLSRGQNTKLMLAAAISHGAETLIFDEPTSGLDPRSRDEFRDRIQSYMAEDEAHTVLFSTHITADLEAIADFIAFIHEGELAFYGTTDEFLDAFRLVTAREEDLEPLDESRIFGKKRAATHVEVLVGREDAARVEDGAVVRKPSIDEIMTYYHRGDANDHKL